MEIFYQEGYFIKNNQILSILILIPMLILSFILTFKSDSIDNNAKATIYNYVECINKKDLDSISKLVTKDKVSESKEQIKIRADRLNINNKDILFLGETDINLINDYLKDNSLYDKNLKIFKINYSINYENETESKTYESLCSLISDQ